jgi:hypothetical protein
MICAKFRGYWERLTSERRRRCFTRQRIVSSAVLRNGAVFVGARDTRRKPCHRARHSRTPLFSKRDVKNTANRFGLVLDPARLTDQEEDAYLAGA